MSGTGYIIGPQIPQGLATMVEGLAREILRHRPADVYAFAARHFEELMTLREKERNNNTEIVTQLYDLAEETAAVNKLTTPSVARNAPARKRREATNECGWSIERTVKVFKKHGLGRDARDVNIKDAKGIKKEQAEKEKGKKIDYSNRCVRSSSVGDLLGEKIGYRAEIELELGEGRLSWKKEARKAKRREYESGSRRQKSVDEIEGDGRIERGEENRGQPIVRRRSRSVANDGERSKRKVSEGIRGRKRPTTATEWRSSFRIESEDQREATESVKTFQTNPKRNEKESKNNYERERERERDRIECFDVGFVHDRDEENVVSSTARKDRSESLIVLPSVVTRQSTSNKCSMNEKRESDETAVRHSFVLPPISSDFSKMVQTENDLTLPSLSNGRTIDISVRDDLRDSTNSSRFESVRSMSEPRTWDDERPNDIARRKSSWLTEENDHENEIVVLSGITIVERDSGDQATAARLSKQIDNLGYSSSRETDIEQVFKDSLNVTPDSIECSQRSDSLEHLREENDRSEQTITDGRNESNELERKLMEIETVEQIIENTLVSSETAGNSINVFEPEFPPIGFTVDLDSDEGTETKEKASLERESTLDKIQIVENVENVENVEDAKNIDTDTDTDIDDGSNVSASVPVPEYSSTKSDPSCYVLTEGSPCEIPESVTTVIIPDKNVENDETFQFHNSETYNEPFGDRVYSEIFECPTSIDVDFFVEIRNAVDRTTTCQDLENINEEEESERERENNRGVTSTVSDYLEKENTNGHDRQDIIANGDVQDLNREQNIEMTRKESGCGPYVPELNLDSLGDVTTSCLGISESVTVEEDRCRVRKKRNLQEIGDNSFREGENTLSSFDTLPSEEKASFDEDENENDYRKIVERTNVVDETENRRTESRDHHRLFPRGLTDCSSNLEEEIAKELIKNLILETPIVPEQSNTDTNDSNLSSSIRTNEKETNVDNVFEANIDTNTSLKEREDKDGNEVTTKTTMATVNRGNDAVLFSETTDRITSEKLPNDRYARIEKGTLQHRRLPEADESDQSAITLNVAPPSTPKHTQKQLGGNSTIESRTRGGLWHTGEFHDSLPLPILEDFPKIFSIKNDLTTISSDIQSITTTTTTMTATTTTTTTYPWFIVEPDRIGCRKFAVDSDAEILVAESSPPRPSLCYAINLSRGLRSLETTLSFIDSSLNVLPCIVRVEPVVDDICNTNGIPFMGNTLDSDHRYDLREPLALDDEEPKRSIVIEEISTDDEKEKEGEQTLSLNSYRTGLCPLKYSSSKSNDDTDKSNATSIYKTNGRTSIDDDGPLTNYTSVHVSAFRLPENTANEGRAEREGEGGKGGNGKETAEEKEGEEERREEEGSNREAYKIEAV